MTATLTITSSWQVPLAQPAPSTATSLYPLGAVSEALPPLFLTSFEGPDSNGNWATALNDALAAGYDRILIDGPADSAPQTFIFDQATIDRPCELIFGRNALVVSKKPPVSDSFSPYFKVSPYYFGVTSSNVTIRGLNATGVPMLQQVDSTGTLRGSGANVICQVVTSSLVDGPVTIVFGQGGSGYTTSVNSGTLYSFPPRFTLIRSARNRYSVPEFPRYSVPEFPPSFFPIQNPSCHRNRAR